MVNSMVRLLALVSIFGVSSSFGREWKIAGLPIKGVPTLMNMWNLTFEQHLNNYFNSSLGYSGIGADDTFKLEPKLFQEMYDSVSAGSVDFVYTNPGMFACLEAEFGLTAIATQTNKRQGQVLSKFGGVFIALANRTDLNGLGDIRGKILEAVSISGLGAAQLQWKTMVDNGYSFLNDPKQVRFSGNQNLILQDVLNGKADVGCVRTDLVEGQIAAGTVPATAIKYLHDRQEPGFPFNVSTDFTPEWPLAAASHVSFDMRTAVASALFALQANSTANIAAQVGTWMAPLSYQVLHKVNRITGWSDASGICVRPASLYDSVRCPAGYYKVSATTFTTSCPDCPTCVGSACANYTCLCRPCIPIPPDRFSIYNSIQNVTCTKMGECGNVTEYQTTRFKIQDSGIDLLGNAVGFNASIKFRLGREEWQNVTAVTGTPGLYEFEVSYPRISVLIVEIQVDGHNTVKDSPFLVNILKMDCGSSLVNDGGGNCILPSSNPLTNGTRAFGMIVFALITCTCVTLGVWVAYNRSGKVVKAAQPFFLYMLLFGCVISSSLLLFASLDEADASPEVLTSLCHAQVWFYFMGFSLTFSAIFAKVNRLRAIFHQRSLQVIHVTVFQASKVVLIMLSFVFIILISWQIFDPLEWKRFPVRESKYGDVLESRGSCSSSHADEYMAVLLTFCVLSYVYGQNDYCQCGSKLLRACS